MTPRRVRTIAALAAVVGIAIIAGCTGTSGHHHRPSQSAPPSSARITPEPTSSGGSASGPSATLSNGVTVIPLSKLDGATVPTTFILLDDTRGVTKSRFYLDNDGKVFLSSAEAAPFQTAISVDAGPNTVQVRHEIDGERTRLEVTFTAKPGSRLQPATPSVAPSAPSRAVAVPVPPATVTVSSAARLAAALRAARPGTVIHLEDGVYVNGRGKRWLLSASGTAASPITLEGGRGAVLQSDSISGDYGVSITGSYWHVLGISVRNASKGIVLDNSQHTIIDNVEVGNIGDEGVHFRTCSSDGVLQNSFIHDTGKKAPNFGEGAYVGSANSNWSKYGCRDGQDKSENTVIRGNTFQNIAAEGLDLKEGTDSGRVLGNAFVNAGYSGKNSADSAIDVKGNNWVIAGNIASAPSGAAKDAFQTHSVYPGYGTGNVFAANTVTGPWPGYAFAMFPQAANIVFCSNRDRGAKEGLVGNNGRRVNCAR